MRLALAQMKMDTSMDRNLAMTIQYMERAAAYRTAAVPVQS